MSVYGASTHLLRLHLFHKSRQILSLHFLVQRLQLQLTLSHQLQHVLIGIWRHLSCCVLALERNGRILRERKIKTRNIVTY